MSQAPASRDDGAPSTDDGAQRALDLRNRAYWEELCGSSLARSIGITDASDESLARFDRAYLDIYPYLEAYLPTATLAEERVLELGLGYGTLGRVLADRAHSYVGVDIARAPVAMMRQCLEPRSTGRPTTALVASALVLPFRERSFDAVYAIGCLHHTGDLERAVREVRRVLAPAGRAVIMLYNRWSFRRLCQDPLAPIRGLWSGAERRLDTLAYDANGGEPAPFTEFVSRRDVRRIFRDFSAVRIDCRNFDAYSLLGGRLFVPRERLLDNVGRLLGLDLYVVATA